LFQVPAAVMEHAHDGFCDRDLLGEIALFRTGAHRFHYRHEHDEHTDSSAGRKHPEYVSTDHQNSHLESISLRMTILPHRIKCGVDRRSRRSDFYVAIAHLSAIAGRTRQYRRATSSERVPEMPPAA
jgi:hypothetical protein